MRGGRMRYRVAGEGPPLVLLHGLSGSWRWWQRNVPRLAAQRELHLVELPGFGSHRGRRFDLADAPAALRAWLDAAELERVDVVGHSLGGLVAARLAARFPEVVDRLVLVAPAGVPDGRSLPRHLLPLAIAAAASGPHLLTLLVGDALRAGAPNLVRAAWDVRRDDVRADLSSILAPTLLVWGRHDPLVPLELAAAFEHGIADVRLAVIPHAGHVPMFDRPDEFDRVVLDFLEATPG